MISATLIDIHRLPPVDFSYSLTWIVIILTGIAIILAAN
jgi:low affinity Fe/Cu permease